MHTMHLLEFLAALGAVQGALLLLLVLFRYRHHKNVPLALLVLAFSLRLGTIPSWNEAALLAYPWLLPVTTPLPFLFGPLLWWYVRELSRDEDAQPRWLLLHAVPYLLELVLTTLTVILSGQDEWREFVVLTFAGQPPLWLPVRNALKVIANAVYVLLAVRIAFGLGGSSTDHLGRARRLWLRTIVVVPIFSLIAFGVVAVFPAVTARLSAGSVFPFLVLAATMASFIYLVSLLVLITPEAPFGIGPPHKQRTAMTIPQDEEERIAGQVRRVLDEGGFRDTDISLAHLAAHLDLHPNRLSAVINDTFGESFPALLCRYRLRYFVDRADAGALDQQTILDLSLESGFPSKSTFNRVFKDHFGVSPSEYVRRRRTHSD